MKTLIFLFLLITSSAFGKARLLTDVVKDISRDIRNQIELTYFVDEIITYENVTMAKLDLKIYVNYQTKEDLSSDIINIKIREIIQSRLTESDCYASLFIKLEKVKISATIIIVRPFTGKSILAHSPSSDKINYLHEGELAYGSSSSLSDERSRN